MGTESVISKVAMLPGVLLQTSNIYGIQFSQETIHWISDKRKASIRTELGFKINDASIGPNCSEFKIPK